MKKIFLILLLAAMSYGAPSYYYADSAGAGTFDGLSWANRFNRDSLVHFMSTHATAGVVVYFMKSTMTIAANFDWNTIAGTAIDPICMICVKTGTTNTDSSIVYADLALDSADRAVINGGTAYYLRTGNYAIIMGFNIISKAGSVYRTGTNTKTKNCYIHNSNTSAANYNVINAGGNCLFDNCVIRADKCNGVIHTGNIWWTDCKFIGNYDPTYGVGITQSGANTFVNCRFFGWRIANNMGVIVNTLYYGCNLRGDSTHFLGTTANCMFAKNCIIDSAYKNIANFSTRSHTNTFWNNCVNEDGSGTWEGIDTSGIFRDFKKVVGNPLVDPVTDTIPSSSPAYNAGE